jgi:hypothetical protein
MKTVTASFPDSVTLKGKGHVLEFCPDNTCHGFVSAPSVRTAALKDFAYLYLFFFSDFIYMPSWRSQAQPVSVADRILQRPEYRQCKKDQSVETARCILLDLNRSDRIKLIFVRYDERHRNVVPENLREELSRR